MIRIARLAALLLVTALLPTCGDDGPPECQKPAECVAVGADSCFKVAGHGRCVLSCAAANGQDSCPVQLECTGKADNGATYCAGKPR
jgi:hypothetical protein